MIVKKLQIPAHIPRIVSKRLFDLSCPLYAYWVTIEKYRLSNAGTRYRLAFLFSVFPYNLFRRLNRYRGCDTLLGNTRRAVSCLARPIANLKHRYNEHRTEKQQSPSFSCKEKGQSRSKNEHTQYPTWEPYCHKSTCSDVAKQQPKTEARRPKDSYDQNITHNGGPFLTGIDKKSLVTLDVILGAPIRKIATRVRENISLFHRPARPTGFPIVPGEGFVLVGNGAIDVLPDLIDTVQIMSAFNQVPFRVTCQTLQDFIARAREKRFVRLIYGHHQIPFSDRFYTVVTLPKRYRVAPVQIVRFLGINLRVCGSPKNQKESGNE